MPRNASRRAGLTGQAIIVKISQRSTTDVARAREAFARAAPSRPPAHLYSRFDRLSVILHLPRPTVICWRVAEDGLPIATRFNLALRIDETHFFAASRTMVPRLLMRYLKPFDGLSSVRGSLRCETRDHLPLLARVKKRQAGEHVCLRSEFDARARPHSLPRRSRPHSRAARTRYGSTEFQVNISNRFSAPAEVALPGAGHTQPEPREARFPVSAAEQLFVLSTRPAVGLPRQFISSLMRARLRGSVASALRGT